MEKLKYSYFINMVKYENQVLNEIIRRNDEKAVSIEIREVIELIEKEEGRENSSIVTRRKGTIKIAEDLIKINSNKKLDALEQVSDPRVNIESDGIRLCSGV